MSERSIEVKTIKVDYYCDECNEPMRNGGMVYDTYPAMYPHSCKNGHQRSFYACYPEIRQVESPLQEAVKEHVHLWPDSGAGLPDRADTACTVCGKKWAATKEAQ